MRALIVFGVAAAILATLSPATITPAAAKTRGLDNADYVWVRVPRRHKRHYSRRLRPEQVFIVERQKCTKMCMLDLSPCDPMEFKIADARCTNPSATGGGARF